jgi:putative ABC transport system permease protein
MVSSWRDLRHAARGLRKRPGFTSVVVLTVAVAIAGSTAIFSVINAVLLRPLPFGTPQRLVTLDVRSPQGFLISLSIPNYRDWRERNRVFESFGATAGWGFVLTGRGRAEVVSAEIVLGDFFGTLGMTPALGRLIPDGETGPGAEPVVVLGHGFWLRSFGGDAAALGHTLVLDERPYTVVGVLAPGVGYPSPDTEVYAPLGVLAPELPWEDRESSFGTRAVARLAPGVTLEAAQRDMDRVGREVRELVGEEAALPEVRTLTDLFVGDVRAELWVLMGAVTFVLLIAAVNVANLLLARGEDRRREVTVRMALGAGRGAVVRQVLTESLVVAAIGGAVGVLAAALAARLLVPLLPNPVPESLSQRIRVDGAVLRFALELTTATGLLFGLIPAWRASRWSPMQELRTTWQESAPGRQRLRSALVVAEVALALVLLIGAGLMLESLRRLRHVDKGFAAERVLTARVSPSSARSGDEERWRAFYREVLTRARALPGVESAALTLLLPLAGRSWELGILPDNEPFEAGQGRSVLYGIVSPEYFTTLGVPVLRGRGFTAADRDEGAPVAVIDETMAERFWPGEDPIGRRVTFEVAPGSTPENPIPVYRTVVGVAKNVRHYELVTPSRIQVYVPFEQTLERWGMGLSLVLRATGSTEALVEPLRREVAAVDGDAVVYEAATVQQYVDADLSATRAVAGMLVAFGLTALLLAGIGIFGVMSYTVVQRRREIGIRIALGARGGDVLRWVAGQSLLLGLSGVAVGLIGAAALSRVLGGLLFGVRPIDPFTYATLGLFLLGVTLLSAYLPARRAARVDPVVVLKE